MTPKTIRIRLRKIMKYISSRVFERDNEIRSLALSLISGAPLLLIGPKGASKTEMIRLFSELLGLRLFETLITSHTKPDQVFGPLDIPKLAEGRVEHKVENFAPTADLAFFDEIFKGNSITLNPLLWFVNEGIFQNGDKGVVHCPRLTTLAASNEIPTDPELGPVYDRFVIRHVVSYLEDKDSLRAMIDNTLNTVKVERPKLLNRRALLTARVESRKIELPAEVRETILKIHAQVKQQLNVDISDRRLNTSIRVLQAAAFLDGKTKVEPKHLSILASIFWEDPTQAVKVANIVMQHADAVLGDVLSFADSAQSIYDSAVHTGEIETSLKEVEKIAAVSAKFSGAEGKKVHRRIQGLLDRLVQIREARSVMLIVEVKDSTTYSWWKLADSSAVLWSPRQLRSVGFKRRLAGGFWWQEIAKDRTAFDKLVRKKLKATVTVKPLF